MVAMGGGFDKIEAPYPQHCVMSYRGQFTQLKVVAGLELTVEESLLLCLYPPLHIAIETRVALVQ